MSSQQNFMILSGTAVNTNAFSRWPTSEDAELLRQNTRLCYPVFIIPDYASTQTAIRYNAKTSISIRYADDFEESAYFLRNTTGLLAPGPLSKTKSRTGGSKPVKKRARQDDPDHIDEPESATETADSTIQTRSSMSRNKSSASGMQLLHELGLSCEISTMSKSTTDDFQSQTTFYISACSLQRKSKIASAPRPAPTNNMDAASASTSPSRVVHWHLHSHSAGRNPHIHAILGPALDTHAPCLDLQLLHGALARMKIRKPWPADRRILEEFHRMNGGYDLVIF